jgi:hypothetical protein
MSASPFSVARADVPLDQCLDANTQAQARVRENKFSAAREQLKICVDSSCPMLVRNDCIQRLDQLDRAQPTIVFDAKDADGHDLVDVKVSVDGQPFAERLVGTALPADPGEHEFTFEASGSPAHKQRFVLRQGEKDRRERVVLGVASKAAEGASLATAPPKAEPGGLGAQKVVALGVFGAGVVGLGAGVALALRAKAKADDADAFCAATNCRNKQAVEMSHDATSAGNAATIAFVAGAVGVAGGAVLWLTARPASESPSVGVAFSGTMLHLRGTW